MAVLYAAVAYHFSLKMSRLMIICGPIVSVLAGYPVGIVGDWCIEQVLGLFCKPRVAADADQPWPCRTGGMGSIFRTMWRYFGSCALPLEFRDLAETKAAFADRVPWVDRPGRVAAAAAVVYAIY